MMRTVIHVGIESEASLAGPAGRCIEENSHAVVLLATAHCALGLMAIPAFVISRSGSWEGSDMAHLFNSHRYEL